MIEAGSVAPQPFAPKRKRQRIARPDPSPIAFVYDFHGMRRMGGPGRTRAYELEKLGKLRFVRVGGRTLVDGDSLRALLRHGCSL